MHYRSCTRACCVCLTVQQLLTGCCRVLRWGVLRATCDVARAELEIVLLYNRTELGTE